MSNRCTLCGGKLKSGICTECGMDNRKSDEMYRNALNRDECSSKNLSHVHNQNKAEEYRAPVMNQNREAQSAHTQKKQQNQKNRTYQSANSRTNSRSTGYQSGGNYKKTQYTSSYGSVKKKNKAPLLIILTIAIIMLVGFISVAIAGFEDYSSSISEELSPDYPVFEYEPEWGEVPQIDDTLSPEGDIWEQELTAGTYVVGVDIPEGSYVLTGDEGSSFQISDGAHYMYQSERFGSGDDKITQIDGIPLYTGAIVYIDGMPPVKFSTQNGQVADMTPRQENPVKESFEVSGDKFAGKDFPAGTYDIEIIGEDYGVLKYEITQKGEASYPLSFSVLMDAKQVDEYPEYCKVYKNVVLPEDAVIHTEEFTVKLIPSEGITSEDYDSFYNNMY